MSKKRGNLVAALSGMTEDASVESFPTEPEFEPNVIDPDPRPATGVIRPKRLLKVEKVQITFTVTKKDRTRLRRHAEDEDMGGRMQELMHVALNEYLKNHNLQPLIPVKSTRDQI